MTELFKGTHVQLFKCLGVMTHVQAVEEVADFQKNVTH